MSAPLPFDEEPARSGTITLSETVKLSQIGEAPGFNPRTDYGEQDGTLVALADSIREFGVLTPPILVQTDTEAYLVVDGHRRIAAARIAGLTEVDCQVMTWQWEEDRQKAKAAYTPEALLSLAMVANLQRKDMNCMEIAEGIVRLEKLGKTQADIAKIISRSQGRVSNLARLLTLPDGVRAYLRTGELSQSHGEELLPLLGECFMTGEIETLASKAVEQGLTANGLRHVVREKIERATPKQTSIDDVTEATEQAGHSAPNNEEFDDARIARTLAATKGLDKSELGSFDKDPKPTPKDTNGLTRKESDKEFAAAMAPDRDVVPLSERPSPAPASSANMLEIEPRYLKVLADLSLTREYLSFRIGDILGDIIERRARELGVLSLEPVAPVTAEVFPVFEEAPIKPVRQPLPPVIYLEAGEANCNYWEFARGFSGVNDNKIHKSIWTWVDPAGIERGFITPLGSINRQDTTSAWFLMLEVVPLEEYGEEPVRDYTSDDYHALIGNHNPAPENLRGLALYKNTRCYVLTGETVQVEFDFNGGKPTKRAGKAESAPAGEATTSKALTPSEAGEAQRRKEIADQEAAAERKAKRQKEHEEKLAAKAQTEVTFRVTYCYPQHGEWQGGGDCEIEDGAPASFKSLVDARAFAAEESARNPRFLVHVSIWTEHLDRQYDRCQQRGDLWFFRGQSVPGGVSSSIPSEESLAVVGCVVSELEAQEEPAQSEGASLDLFGMDEAQATTSLVDDMAGRLV